MMELFPTMIHKFYRTGTGNMGDVTDAETAVQMTLTDAATGNYIPFVLASFLAWFTGGSGSATLSLKQRLNKARMNTSHYDNTIRQFENAGTGGEDFIAFRIDPQESHHFSYAAGDVLIPEWTNPAAGTMRWALEIRLHPLEVG